MTRQSNPRSSCRRLDTFAYNLRFPGQVFDGQAGLHQNWMRDYDPATGRYGQSDSIGLRGGINTYAYVGGSPLNGWDPLGLCDEKDNCVPRPEVIAWICQVVLANSNVDFDVRRAASAAYGLREAEGGKNDNPIWREGENWLTSAAFNGWLDGQAYVLNIYIWQYAKYLPISKESFSQDALNAGLDGHKHANRSSKDDLKKWCHDCGKQ